MKRQTDRLAARSPGSPLHIFCRCSIRWLLLLLQLHHRGLCSDGRVCGCGLERKRRGVRLADAEHLHVAAEDSLLFPLLDLQPPADSLRPSSERKPTMSASLPKSESTTSLLRSSGLNRRSAHSDHGPHGHRSHRGHCHPTGAGGGDDAGWTEDCEPSARRPLCQPRHADSRNLGDHHRVQKSHAHRQTGPQDDGYAQEDVRHRTSRHQRERGKSSRSKHSHHHHDSSRGELPPAEHHHQGGSRQDRRTSPTPSYPQNADDAAFFFEPRERVITGSSSSLSSDPPAASAPVQPASSRTSKRLSATSSEYDSSLHPIVKSVFGQVRRHGEEIKTFGNVLKVDAKHNPSCRE